MPATICLVSSSDETTNTTMETPTLKTSSNPQCQIPLTQDLGNRYQHMNICVVRGEKIANHNNGFVWNFFSGQNSLLGMGKGILMYRNRSSFTSFDFSYILQGTSVLPLVSRTSRRVESFFHRKPSQPYGKQLLALFGRKPV